jgi:hypothetical protein
MGAFRTVNLMMEVRVRDTYQVGAGKRVEQCPESRTEKMIGFGGGISSVSGASGRPDYDGESSLHWSSIEQPRTYSSTVYLPR